MTSNQPVGVTITGLGVVSSLGLDVGETFDALCSGRSGLTRPDPTLADESHIEVVSQSPEIDPVSVLPPPIDPCADRFQLLVLAAADRAMRDAGIRTGENVDPYRTGVVVSTAGGALETFEEYAYARRTRGRTAVSPYLAPGMVPNMGAARIAIKYNIRGYSSCISTACAAGAQSIAEAFRLIRGGEADVVVCGASDSPLHPTVAASFVNAKSLAHGFEDPTESSRPFDMARNGYVLGEGAAVLVIERADHAAARGVAGYADVIGWGMTTDAYHVTKPRPGGVCAAEAMRRALVSAGLSAGDIGYLNAHGTSTKLGDIAEATAIREVFGENGPAVSSTKSAVGHLLGAAGAFEGAVTALAVNSGLLPPTVNLEEVDPRCELDHVRGKARSSQVDAVMTNSLGFGGHNVSVVMTAPSTPLRRSPDGSVADV